jgi:hypothetical protein
LPTTQKKIFLVNPAVLNEFGSSTFDDLDLKRLPEAQRCIVKMAVRVL